jgi:hypothetical protein
VKENTNRLTNSEKVTTIKLMLDFIMDHELPVPNNFEVKHENLIKAYSNLWPFESNVVWPEGKPYNQDEMRALQTTALNNWIKDVALRVTNLGRGYKVTKEWDDYLSIHIDCPTENWRLTYAVQREVVCERKVVGKRHVEAVVLKAHDEEIVEWECNDKSLLGGDGE